MFATLLTALAAAIPGPSPSPSADPGATAMPKPQAGTPMTREQRYCVHQYRTGSRIRKVDCRTRGEWLKDGFDPLAPD